MAVGMAYDSYGVMVPVSLRVRPVIRRRAESFRSATRLQTTGPRSLMRSAWRTATGARLPRARRAGRRCQPADAARWF